MEQTEVAVDLSSTYWKLAPKAKVYLDDNLIFDNKVSEPITAKWVGELEDGEHSIIIELYDKDKFQTVLENGVIIKDQILGIDAIKFDDIDIGILRTLLSKYYPNPTKDNPNPEPIIKCVNLGINGRWELKFTTPIYIWLLENM